APWRDGVNFSARESAGSGNRTAAARGGILELAADRTFEGGGAGGRYGDELGTDRNRGHARDRSGARLHGPSGVGPPSMTRPGPYASAVRIGRVGRGRGVAVPYYTDVGSRGDWILGSETPAVIAVLEAPGQSTPVGIAFRVGGDHAGRALWTLRVYD